MDVFIDHAVDCEVPFNMAATGCAVDRFNASNSLNGLVHAADQKTTLAVFDQFRHAAPIKGDYRRTAGHGFDNGQTERLIKLYWVQQRAGLAEQAVALYRSDAADINHHLIIYVRGDISVIVNLILDNARQYQLSIAALRDFNRLSDPLVTVNAPEKKQGDVRDRLKIKLLDINSVMDGFDIIKIR